MVRVDIRTVGVLLVSVIIVAFLLGKWIGKEPPTEQGAWSASDLTRGHISSLVIDPRNRGTMYALVDYLRLARSVDGGKHWTFGSSQPPTQLLCSSAALAPSAPTTIYALCAPGSEVTPQYAIYRTTDGGKHWSVFDGSRAIALRRILVVDRQNPTVLYATNNVTLYKSTNGGETWEPRMPDLPTQAFWALAVDPTNPAILYTLVSLPGSAATYGLTTGLFKSENGGATWQELGSPRFWQHPFFALAVHPRMPSVLFASGNGGVWKSSDGGKSWATSGLLSIVQSFAFDVETPNIVYASSSGEIMCSTDGGDSWDTLNKGFSADISVLALHKTRLYVGTLREGVYSLGVDNVQLPKLAVTVESPEDGQPVSGLTLVRVKAQNLDNQLQPSLLQGALFFADLQQICCVKQIQAKGSTETEWGLMFNWGQVNTGTFEARIRLETEQGTILYPRPPTVTVVKPGGFSSIDQFDLSTAKATVIGNELALTGLVVRDKVTQQQKRIPACFRWFASSQSFGLTPADMCEAKVAQANTQLVPTRSFLGRLFHFFFGFVLSMTEASVAYGDEAIRISIEGPPNQQFVTGVGAFHGWAFPVDGNATIREIRLLIDGTPREVIPCCLVRTDVFGHFYKYDAAHNNASSSGWGTLVNYGELTAGAHRIGVRIEDSAGNVAVSERAITVIRIGGFVWVDHLDLARAHVQIEGDEIILSRVTAREKSSQRTKVTDLRLRWVEHLQSLGIVASTSS